MTGEFDQVDIPESPDREVAQPEVATEVAEVAPVEVAKATPNTTQEFETFRAADKWNEEDETLHLPAGRADDVRNVLTEGPNVRLDDSKDGREWSDSLRESADALHVRGVYDRTADREGADWRQAIPSEKMNLAAGIPNLKFNTGDKVAGERAVLRMRSLLGLGTILQIPLWHSGFWITMKAPSEASLLELQRRLIENKINLGRNTHGLAFANTSVFISGWLIDFVLAHIWDTTLKGEVDLRKTIRILDIPTIVWGLACTIWPSGFQYTRACIAEPEKCNHVVREKLNLGKLLWVDRNSLTPWQISHMTNRGGSTMSLESVQRYLDEFTLARGRSIAFSDDSVVVNFKIPTVEDYVNSGYKWVNNIVSMIDSSFTAEPNDTTRNIHITELGKATSMRQYAHWIESIDAAGSVIDDVESIEQVIDTMSTVDEIRTKYFEEIIKYIDDSTISIVAVPTFECPKCGGDQPVPLPRFPHLLPIDVVSSFFTLLVQKLQKIHIR